MVENEAKRQVWLNQVGARRPAPRAGRGAKEGLDLLCRAYGADPGHPGVLAALAACSLLRGDTVRAGALAGGGGVGRYCFGDTLSSYSARRDAVPPCVRSAAEAAGGQACRALRLTGGLQGRVRVDPSLILPYRRRARTTRPAASRTRTVATSRPASWTHGCRCRCWAWRR